MATPPRILAFSGSARKESLNRKFLGVAVQAVRAAGGEVTLIDLNDYELPLYHGDLEEAKGLPANAVKLIELITRHAALLIASPEYNSSITAVFKNTIDWVSRPAPGGRSPFSNKIVALMSASAGALGGLRGLVHVRAIFGNLGAVVLPGQITISKAHEAFTAEGQLKDERQQVNVEKLGAALSAAVEKWNR